jgi:hypothetical protein
LRLFLRPFCFAAHSLCLARIEFADEVERLIHGLDTAASNWRLALWSRSLPAHRVNVRINVRGRVRAGVTVVLR